MATRTRTVEARKYDHLYDPDFAVSGAVDFAKATQAAQFAGLVRAERVVCLVSLSIPVPVPVLLCVEGVGCS